MEDRRSNDRRTLRAIITHTVLHIKKMRQRGDYYSGRTIQGLLFQKEKIDVLIGHGKASLIKNITGKIKLKNFRDYLFFFFKLREEIKKASFFY